MKDENRFLQSVTTKGEELGYPPEHLPLLLLVPFVEVAWAEGFVQASEQKAILRFAASLGVKPGHPAYEKLLEWFDERPQDEFFSRSVDDLRALLASVPAKQAARIRSMLQFGCVEVAHASGDIGLLRGRSNIRREERVALQSLSARLGLSLAYV